MWRTLLIGIALHGVSIINAEELPDKTINIFMEDCGLCHGPESRGYGGLNFITNLKALVNRGLIIPSDPEQSPLYQRLITENEGLLMPAGGPRLSEQKLETIWQWIKSGAPHGSSQEESEFLTLSTVYRLITKDLETLTRLGHDVSRQRYILTQDVDGRLETDTVLASFSQVINSLSWQPFFAPLRSVDPGGKIIAIDLDDIGWSQRQWDLFTQNYPYSSTVIDRYSRVASFYTQALHPLILASWAVAQALQPTHYHQLLGLPRHIKKLEAMLHIDFASDYRRSRPQRRTLLRAGFNRSGVSQYNRVIERRVTAYGSFWQSYDFAANSGQKHIFSYPLGPGAGFGQVEATGEDLGFNHDGGEVIFNLPNGLQAYYLTDASGNRLDTAPANIVFNRQKGEEIQNGISCMFCHQQGMLEKRDEILPSLAFDVFDFYARKKIERLYGTQSELQDAFDQDRRRFLDALQKAGLGNQNNHLLTLVDLYEQDVNLSQACRELGLSHEQFRKRSSVLPDDLIRTIAPLLQDGPLPRDTFEAIYRDLHSYIGESELQEVEVIRADLRKPLNPGLHTVPIPLNQAGILERLTVDVAIQGIDSCGTELVIVNPSGFSHKIKARGQGPCHQDLFWRYHSDINGLGRLAQEDILGTWYLEVRHASHPSGIVPTLRKLRLQWFFR